MHCIKQNIKSGPVNKNTAEHLFINLDTSLPNVLSFDASHRSLNRIYPTEN